MKINRRPIFAAVKALRGGQGFNLAEVKLLDGAIDQAFVEAELPNVLAAPSTTIAPPATTGLHDSRAFFDHLRSSRMLGPSLSADEVNGCSAITAACGAAGWPIAWTAYALATAYHETAGTMQPIREYGRGKGRKYGVTGRHGQVAYGRGYVQLTWDYNYEKADKELGLEGRLTKDYELALQHDLAADIMVKGMACGWFTSKRLSDYLSSSGPGTLAQFDGARRIINGTDKARKIAEHALDFQRALSAGQWG